MSSAIPINCIGFIGSLNMKIPAIHGRRSPAELAIAARTITPLLSASMLQNRLTASETAPRAEIPTAGRLKPDIPSNRSITKAISPAKV